ncbi:MAG: HAD hydrolase family protein [Clostridia bacterium]|nr:HAD hydrolase family protein [Clostridia bacterium]
MPRLPYRAVILDLDRTLLRDDKTVSEEALGVLRECAEAGALLYAATARPIRAITAYREMIGFRSVTTLNGALTVTPDGVFAEPIAPADALSLLEQLGRVGKAVVSVEAEHGFYANREIPEWQPAVLEDLRVLPGRDRVFKVLASHPSVPADRIPVTPPDGVYATVAERTLLQFMSRRATKWNGILRILSHDGIDPADAVCFGDDQDDVEPIRRCGLGVAVGNALDCVKAVADDIAPSNNDDGVARYLRGLLSR